MPSPRCHDSKARKINLYEAFTRILSLQQRAIRSNIEANILLLRIKMEGVVVALPISRHLTTLFLGEKPDFNLGRAHSFKSFRRGEDRARITGTLQEAGL